MVIYAVTDVVMIVSYLAVEEKGALKCETHYVTKEIPMLVVTRKLDSWQ